MSLRRSQRSSQAKTAADSSATENEEEPVLADCVTRKPFGGSFSANALAAAMGKRKQSDPKKSSIATDSVKTQPPSPPSAAAPSLPMISKAIPKLMGARCAVYFTQDKDFFGSSRELKGWYPATIERIYRSHKTITARFDDHSKDEGVPYSDIRMLRPGRTESDRSVCYWTVDGEERVFCDHRPVSLQRGDLVVAYFQNGHFEPNRAAWYRGRIAGTSKSAAGITLADIAYDDGDLEKDVPYGVSYGYITLLERGFEHPSWLDGLTVHIPSKKWKTCKFGVIQATQPNQPVQICYTKDGKELVEKRSYSDVVKVLFATEIKQGNKRCCYWPFPQHAIDMGEEEESPMPTKQKKRKPKTAERVPSRKRVKPPSTDDCDEEEDAMDLEAAELNVQKPSRKSRAKKVPPKPKDDDDDDDDDDYVDAKPAVKATRVKKESAPPKPRAAAVKSVVAKKAAKITTIAMDDGVEALAETVWNLQLDPELPEPPRPLKLLGNAIAGPFGKALNSCDAALGADLLTFMGSMHDRIPNDVTWKTVLDLNSFGPKSENTYFPDPHKMDLTLDYAKQVFSKRGMLDACSDYIDRQFKTNHKGVSYAETFLNQMTEEYYTAEGDEMRGTSHAVKRIVQSLHAKACFADIFAILLRHQLKPCVVADREGNSTAKNYQTLPIVRDILVARRGAKDTFEKAVKACAQLWMRYGPFMLSDVSDAMKNGEDVPKELLGSIQHEMLRLTDTMGTVVSYMAWIYSKEANEDAYALADISSNILLREINETTLDVEPLLGGMSKDKFIEKVKLRFIIAIKKEVTPQFRPKLAELLGVAALYNIIYGLAESMDAVSKK